MTETGINKEERRITEVVWFFKYRIIRELGRGGFSTVFLAEHIGLNSLRAIKRIRKDQKFYGQLMNEVTILKSLNHPCVPIIYDIEEDKEYSYIIEEFIDGESLKTYRLKKKKLSEGEVLLLAEQICEVLQYLHKCGSILYLDLKPENLIYSSGKVKFLDFGAALRKNSCEKGEYSFGTRLYASPEQINGLNEVDERSDIYSIGVLLYFLITGKEYQKTMVSRKWSWMLLSNNRLYKIIETCLMPEPEKRYQSIVHLRNVLRLVDKKEKQKFKIPVMSYDIGIAGTKRGIGVTHISLTIAKYLSFINKSAIYIEWTPEADSIRKFRGGNLMGNGNAVPVQTVNYWDWKKEQNKERYLFRLYDFGELSEFNLSEFLDCECRIVVLGTKPWEQLAARKWISELCDMRGVLYLANLSSAQCVCEASELVLPEICLQVPVLKSLFERNVKKEERIFLDKLCSYIANYVLGEKGDRDSKK